MPAWTAHPSAIIDEGAQIGAGTRIWHWVHVCGGARIGEGCSLGQNVFVGNDVRIGNNVKIQNNVSVYDAVTLEDDVFCGPSMVFTNVYNPRAAVTRKDAYRRTLVRQGATIGANATIVCGHTVGRYAFIGAGAVVQKDVPDFALMVGVPARQIGWMSRFGERLDLPLHGTGETTCPHTGDQYRLQDGRVSIIEAARSAGSLPAIQLVHTGAEDVDFVISCEADEGASPFITRWSKAQHLDALQDPDCLHRLIVDAATGARIGFVMLFGLASSDRTIELRRIVCNARGKGYGRAALQAIKALALQQGHTPRIWLDVKPDNAPARHLYASEGFREQEQRDARGWIIMWLEQAPLYNG